MSDCASEALAEASVPGEPRTYDAISKRKENALKKGLKLMSGLGNPMQIKFLPSPAFRTHETLEILEFCFENNHPVSPALSHLPQALAL